MDIEKSKEAISSGKLGKDLAEYVPAACIVPFLSSDLVFHVRSFVCLIPSVYDNRHVIALEENSRPSVYGMTYEILKAVENP